YEKDLILDPFIGSGTTAIAAQKLNRHYIGYEINDEYCKLAKTRIIESNKLAT
ncbi:MAG: site-specific DNA-methyltransferase, partial [Actinobacteria bacterium]|nr:site-specific DNA-methyltransferase [Actinomycetota bacterium]